jgi:hypothetical protein
MPLLRQVGRRGVAAMAAPKNCDLHEQCPADPAVAPARPAQDGGEPYGPTAVVSTTPLVNWLRDYNHPHQ